MEFIFVVVCQKCADRMYCEVDATFHRHSLGHWFIELLEPVQAYF